MKLPKIDGRECLPVRLLPYLTSWRPLTPDVIAKLFSRRDPLRTWAASTFHLGGDDKNHELLPREWDNVDDSIAILEEGLIRQEAFDLQNYPEWRRLSVETLPAAVFVWRDEFEADYERTFSRQSYPSSRPGAREISEEEAQAELDQIIRICEDPGERANAVLQAIQQRAEGNLVYREGDGKLSFDPLLTDEDRKLVFEGFECLFSFDNQTAASPRPMQRWPAQEAAILAKLVELGFDPKAVPPAPPGMPSAAKTAVREALGYSKEVMRKAWQRLREEGSVKDV